MIELLQCLQLNAPNPQQITTSVTISNLLIALYLIAYLNNKKGFYIGAFLFCEFVGASSLLSGYSSVMFYVYYVTLYVICYWIEFKVGRNVKIMFAYAIMVLFQSAMVSDAYYYPEIKTAIYKSYEYVVMGIHIYIVIVLIKPKSFLKAMGNSIDRLFNFLNIGYGLSFCYTSNIILNQAKKTCLQATKK